MLFRSYDSAEKMKKLIDKYFMQKDELKEKIRQLWVSQSYLSASFKKKYKISPLKYLNLRRLQYAKKLLKDTELTVTDIAASIGFESISAFCAFFKKSTGTSPGTFRSESAADAERMHYSG